MKSTLKTIINESKKEIALSFFFVFLIVLIDQVSKIYVMNNFYLGESYNVIKGFFNFTYVRNPGVAFGFGGNFADEVRYILFRGIPVLACVWLVYLLITSLKQNKLLATAYTLILGGAIGNLIDRFRLDYVVDFFDFYHRTYHFATFNVADSAISVAAALIILDYFIQLKKGKNSSEVSSQS